jgi:hypothetical protein
LPFKKEVLEFSLGSDTRNTIGYENVRKISDFILFCVNLMNLNHAA